MIRLRKNGLGKMVIMVVVLIATFIILLYENSFISAAAFFNVEQQNAVATLKESGINFYFDDNYTLQTKDYIRNNNKTYYFSTSGNDKNSGLSPKTPKKNPFNYFSKSNVNVMLKGGDSFTFRYGTTVGSNVNIGTYGNEERAKISLAYQNSGKFQEFDRANNIYVAACDENVTDFGHLIIEGRNYWARRLKYQLVNSDEYYYDISKKLLYIKSSENLTGKSFSVSLPYNAFMFKNAVNSSIHNIEIANTGIHGVRIITGCSNVQVVNCYVHDIGGSLAENGKKLGNGIEVWGSSCSNIWICNNIVDGCFDAGLTAQVRGNTTEATNIYFANNIVKNCNYGFEFFQNKSTPVKNVVVTNNIICNVRDITNGYRETWSKTDFTAPFCLWYSDSPETSVAITNNFAYSGSYYGISFATYEATQNVYGFTNNTIVVDNSEKKVNNKKNYYGDYGQFIISKHVANMNSYKAYVERSIE